jgi:hypothetical protein
MNEIMKPRFRLYRRHAGVFYLFDRLTGKRESLETSDPAAAKRLLHSRNEAQQQPLINRQIARAYLAASDPETVAAPGALSSTKSSTALPPILPGMFRGSTGARTSREMPTSPMTFPAASWSGNLVVRHHTGFRGRYHCRSRWSMSGFPVHKTWASCSAGTG